MIAAKITANQFAKDMKNIINYSVGFLDGVKMGKKQMLHNIGLLTVERFKDFVDSTARMNPEMLHHIYEWTKTGEERARLFDINFTISNLGLSFTSSFKQSTSIKDGSYEPFYNKAKVMESGQSVVIKPKNSNVLKFKANGEDVFTSNPVYVDSPGGEKTTGGFEKTFDLFFSKYFTQAFLRSSGILEYLSNPTVYKKNMRSGMSNGKFVGYQTGYRWIANVGIGGN